MLIFLIIFGISMPFFHILHTQGAHHRYSNVRRLVSQSYLREWRTLIPAHLYSPHSLVLFIVGNSGPTTGVLTKDACFPTGMSRISYLKLKSLTPSLEFPKVSSASLVPNLILVCLLLHIFHASAPNTLNAKALVSFVLTFHKISEILDRRLHLSNAPVYS